MSKKLALIGLVAGVVTTGAFGTVSASAEEPRCNKAVTSQVHGAHETVEGAGEDTAAEPATSIASGALHTAEIVTCLLPV